MGWLKNFIKKEHTYFNQLGFEGKKLARSIFIFNIISPVLGIFVNAFVFRQTESITLVSIFNIFLFLSVLLGFYINGLLLKYYPPNKLFAFWLVVKGFVFLFLVFSPSFNLLQICVFGIIYGLAIGGFWANRNFLTLLTTKSENRIYFSSLESLSKSITDVITPFIVGLFISFGANNSFFTPVIAYKIIAFLMLMFIAKICMTIITIPSSLKKVDLFIKNREKNWILFRLYNFAMGFLTIGILLIPTLMVLVLVGEEAELGIYQSITALISATAVYLFAKGLDSSHRFKLLVISIVINILGSLIFSLTFSPFGVFVFMASVALSFPFWWAHMSSVTYDLIDSQDWDISKRYAALCDREVFINSGRLISLLLFLYLIINSSDDLALKFIPIAFAVVQIFVFVIARSFEKTQKANVVT